jgi:hypothetical protein
MYLQDPGYCIRGVLTKCNKCLVTITPTSAKEAGAEEIMRTYKRIKGFHTTWVLIQTLAIRDAVEQKTRWLWPRMKKSSIGGKQYLDYL